MSRLPVRPHCRIMKDVGWLHGVSLLIHRSTSKLIYFVDVWVGRSVLLPTYTTTAAETTTDACAVALILLEGTYRLAAERELFISSSVNPTAAPSSLSILNFLQFHHTAE